MSISPLPLVDSHCHFDFEAFADKRAELWQACLDVGMKALVIPTVSPGHCAAAFALADSERGIYSAAGLHPWWVDEWRQRCSGNEIGNLGAQLQEWLSHPKCVAVGECGLDAVIETPLEQQQPLFEQQLQLACDWHRPVIVHVRRAHNETLRLLKRYQPPCGGVIHGFSGSTHLAESYWKLGFRLGVGGTITYPRAEKTRRAIASLPLEALLLETDAPDMPLNGKQGKINSPLYLPEVAQALAELRGESVTDVARETTENSLQLFNIHR